MQRFLTEDPAQDGGNWYAYVGNNPVNGTDPWGLYNPQMAMSGPAFGGPGPGGVDDWTDNWATLGVPSPAEAEPSQSPAGYPWMWASPIPDSLYYGIGEHGNAISTESGPGGPGGGGLMGGAGAPGPGGLGWWKRLKRKFWGDASGFREKWDTVRGYYDATAQMAGMGPGHSDRVLAEHGPLLNDLAGLYASQGMDFLPIGEGIQAWSLLRNADDLADTGRLGTVAVNNKGGLPPGAISFADNTCFIAGTLVWTATGLKAIEEIQEGEYVLTRNEQTGEVSYRRVTRTFVHEHRGDLVTLKVGKESFQVTPNHPIWVEGKGWTPAGDLEAGAEVVRADGGTVRLSAVETTPIRGPPVLVYNLEVEGTHTYFVGREGVWVHNCNNGSPSTLYHYASPQGVAHIHNTGQITPHPTGGLTLSGRPLQQVYATPTPPQNMNPGVFNQMMGQHPTHVFQIQNPGPGWSDFPVHGPLSAPAYVHTPPVSVSECGAQLYWEFTQAGDPIIVVPVIQR